MFTANHLSKLDASLGALQRAERAITTLLARHATPEGRVGGGLVEAALEAGVDVRQAFPTRSTT